MIVQTKKKIKEINKRKNIKEKMDQQLPIYPTYRTKSNVTSLISITKLKFDANTIKSIYEFLITTKTICSLNILSLHLEIVLKY